VDAVPQQQPDYREPKQMPVADVYNIRKEKVAELELSAAVFGTEVKPHVVHDVVRMQLVGRRAGTAATKTRAEVSGGGKKPWRQKGTGRARSGTNRSPLWRGGGIVFGPQPRDYSIKLPQKVKKLGLRIALSARFAEGNMLILDDLPLEKIKTKDFTGIMGALGLDNALIVTAERDDRLEKSSRNVPGIAVLPAVGLNVFDILLHRKLVLTQPCIALLEERLSS